MKRKKRWRSSDGFISMINKLDYVSKKKLLDLIDSDEKKDIELVLLLGDNYRKVNDEAVKLGGSVEDLSYGFAIMKIPVESLDKAVKIEGIQYAEFPKSLYTSFGPTNKSSCIEEVWGKEDVTGKGVLVGFIDTGIDYRHKAFMDESGNKTRIEYIYDLGKGKEWNKTTIDSWISGSGTGEEPPIDRYTHGTHVAGIACGRSDEDKYKGVAYDSSIIMVNFTREGDVVNAQSSQLMRGIKYIIKKSKELNMPAVLNLSYSTNNGAHDGRSLLELYISTITSLEKIVFVCAAGNMGDRGLHKSGTLKKESKIEISVGAGEKGLILNLYRKFYQEISMNIRNPSGVSSGKISISRRINEIFVGKDKVIIYRDEANPYNSRGSIIISIIPAGEIQQGVWSITLSKGDNSQEKYSVWLPIGDNLSPKTKFLNPTLEGTLGIPATVSSVISVGSYNSNTRNISSFSGRGDNEMEVKPDIAAPGENILSSIPGGGYDSLSGTSMATPQVAGAAALLMEWGILKNNDPLMYGERVKYFLIRGARRERKDVQYPNNKWGYGSLCLQEAFNISIMENSGMRVTGIEELKFGKVFTKEDYENYIVEYDDGLIEKINKIKYGSALKLDSHRAIISVKKGYLEKLKREVEEILFVEKSSLFTLNNTSPSDKANISYFHQNPYLTLRGNGVLVGIVDTGIDYLHQEFIYDDDTSKILNLWDQSGVGKNTPDLIGFGKEYSREDINRAIQEKVQGKDPYSIVDSKDDIGHGTQMAGLIGAIGKNPELTGAAPDSEFVIVKMKNAKNTLLKSKGVDADKIAYDSVDIILGIKYIMDVAKKNNKPIVIFIPMGTNRGAHDGSSLLERYLDEICKIRGVAVVTGTGNNGDTGTHTDGKFQRRGEIKNIELKVGEKQKNLSLQIWGKKPDKLSVGLISPSGEIVDKIPAKLMETEEVKLVFEGSSVFITYSIPEEITGDELIDISIFNIKPGIWQLRIYGDFIVDGNYDIWLPQRELLEEGTEFLKPSPYTTSMVPGTARRIITCAAYDQNNNSILATSGRGNTRDNRILPHLAVGGVNVLTTQAGNGSGLISGSSPASAVLAGTIALLLEWGIVKGNDKTMYSTKIKTYLIRGTDRRQGDMYPNNLWGYGTLNLLSVFENIRGIEEKDEKREEEGKFLIRMPNEIYTKLD